MMWCELRRDDEDDAGLAESLFAGGWVGDEGSFSFSFSLSFSLSRSFSRDDVPLSVIPSFITNSSLYNFNCCAQPKWKLSIFEILHQRGREGREGDKERERTTKNKWGEEKQERRAIRPLTGNANRQALRCSLLLSFIIIILIYWLLLLLLFCCCVVSALLSLIMLVYLLVHHWTLRLLSVLIPISFCIPALFVDAAPLAHPLGSASNTTCSLHSPPSPPHHHLYPLYQNHWQAQSNDRDRRQQKSRRAKQRSDAVNRAHMGGAAKCGNRDDRHRVMEWSVGAAWLAVAVCRCCCCCSPLSMLILQWIVFLDLPAVSNGPPLVWSPVDASEQIQTFPSTAIHYVTWDRRSQQHCNDEYLQKHNTTHNTNNNAKHMNGTQRSMAA